MMGVGIRKGRWEKALVGAHSGEAYFIITNVVSHFKVLLPVLAYAFLKALIF